MGWLTSLRTRLAGVLEPNSRKAAALAAEADPSDDVQRLADRALELACDYRVDAGAIAELGNLSRGQRETVFEAEAACLARDDGDFSMRWRAVRLLQDSLYEDTSVATRPPTIAERVKVAFVDRSAASYADKYLEALQTRVRESSDTIRRTALLTLLGLAAFELLSRSAIADVQIGPFKIQDLELIQKTLPIVLAFLLYDISVSNLKMVYAQRAHAKVMDIFYPSIRRTQIDALVLPPGASSSSVFGVSWLPTGSGRLNRLAWRLNSLMWYSSLALPPLAQAYVLYRLFESFRWSDGLVWASAIRSMLFFGSALVVFMLLFQGWKDDTVRPTR
jgi:hypothetical protein